MESRIVEVIEEQQGRQGEREKEGKRERGRRNMTCVRAIEKERKDREQTFTERGRYQCDELFIREPKSKAQEKRREFFKLESKVG